MTTPHTQHTHPADTIIPRYLQPKTTIGKIVYSGKETFDIGDVIIVEWDDAQTVGEEWTEHDRTYTPMPTVTVGFLWENTPTHMTLMSVINLNHHATGTVIPKGCIHTIHTP